MVATSTTLRGTGEKIVRRSDESAANTALTLSTEVGVGRKFLYATVKYSAAPTQAGVTFTLNSGAGAAWDTLLETGAANARDTLHVPDGEFPLLDDDVIDVVAPAAGGSITSAIAIYTEDVG